MPSRIGAAALEQVIAHVRSKGLFSSFTGFQPTGKVDEGEVVLELPLLGK
jgi:hypothetical protein